MKRIILAATLLAVALSPAVARPNVLKGNWYYATVIQALEKRSFYQDSDEQCPHFKSNGCVESHTEDEVGTRIDITIRYKYGEPRRVSKIVCVYGDGCKNIDWKYYGLTK